MRFYRQRRVPVIERQRLHRAVRRHGGGDIDQGRQPPKFLHGVSDGVARVTLARDIGRDGRYAAAAYADLIRHLLGFVVCDIRKNDRRTFCGKALGNGTADLTAAPGQQGDPVFQQVHRSTVLSCCSRSSTRGGLW